MNRKEDNIAKILVYAPPLVIMIIALFTQKWWLYFLLPIHLVLLYVIANSTFLNKIFDYLHERREKSEHKKRKMALQKQKEEWDALPQEVKDKILSDKAIALQVKRDEDKKRKMEDLKRMERQKQEKTIAKKLAEEKAKEEQRILEEQKKQRVQKQLRNEEERKRKQEIEIKNALKKKILEKEERDRLHSEAIKELISEGLLNEKYDIVQPNRPPIPSHIKIAVWERDKKKCVSCSSKVDLEFDHIIPISKGGANTVSNIQILCRKCNRTKGSKIL